MTKVAIFPASGRLGSSIYTHLFRLLPAKELLLISRNPEKTPSHIVQAGVVTRKADSDDSGSLKHCFDGVSCLVLISYPSIETEHRFDVCLCRPSLCQGQSSLKKTGPTDSHRCRISERRISHLLHVSRLRR